MDAARGAPRDTRGPWTNPSPNPNPNPIPNPNPYPYPNPNPNPIPYQVRRAIHEAADELWADVMLEL